MDSREFMRALKLIEKEKGISREEIFTAIENSLLSACKKNFGTSQNIKVDMNTKTGEVKVFAQKEVTEDVYDAFLEISLDEAKEINPNYEYGDFVDIPVTPRNFGRISAQAAKQVVVQKFREAEREKLYNEFIEKEKDIDTGIIRRIENKNVIVSLGNSDAIMPIKEQIPGEVYNVHDRLKVYIVEVRKTTKGPQITVSRTHYELVRRLFELEIPEVYDGTVKIKAIAREAGSRTKMAVYTENKNVDAIGTCVGINGDRVSVIVNELRGENIDIINWSEYPKEYIAEALKPCSIVAIEVFESENDKSAKVVVPDEQLSLAIGKEGQNVRLAARITGFKIDIKSETQAREIGFINFDDESVFDLKATKKIEEQEIEEQEIEGQEIEEQEIEEQEIEEQEIEEQEIEGQEIEEQEIEEQEIEEQEIEGQEIEEQEIDNTNAKEKLDKDIYDENIDIYELDDEELEKMGIYGDDDDYGDDESIYGDDGIDLYDDKLEEIDVYEMDD